jgi:hypothetical protein
VRSHFSIRILVIAVVATLGTGCGSLLIMSGSESDAISFETGELRTTERATLAELDAASRVAIEAVGCELLETQRKPEHVRWQARTAGGDLVEIVLTAKGRNRTALRIRIGVLGDEARSRLVLEEIHKSLSGSASAEQ